ncbi:MAG: hypothetical protein GF364_11635 [Candidatus Lokiarchaeota archaeon]|nr:hypothetical protein [Candidatus Lokiarchaeota archaeon]
MAIISFKKTASRYRKELLESIIPFWEKNCVDRKYGGYYTFLDREGTIYDTDKYIWMQWRIVYEFATLAMSKIKPEKKQDWLEIAEKGYDFLDGWDKKYGGIFYFKDVLERPHIELQWNMKLWWVHNEALIATLLGYSLTKDKKLLELFNKIDKCSLFAGVFSNIV